MEGRDTNLGYVYITWAITMSFCHTVLVSGLYGMASLSPPAANKIARLSSQPTHVTFN